MKKIVFILLFCLVPSVCFADIFPAGPGHGWVQVTDAVWNTAHDATTGTATDDAETMYCGVTATGVGNDYTIYRTFFPFDTSGIPDDATIISAALWVYNTNHDNDDDDGDNWINVVQTDQASPTELADADFNNCGAVDNPTEGATRISLNDFVAETWETWTLDATGLTWIDVTGYTMLGLREGHDCVDSAIGANDGSQFVPFGSTASAELRPYLVIEIVPTAKLRGAELHGATIN